MLLAVAQIAVDSNRPVALRKAAVELLPLGAADQITASLEALLSPGERPAIQHSAARSLAALDDPQACRRLYAQWPKYTKSVRRVILSAAPRSVGARLALVEALEQGRVMAIELPAEVETALKQDASESLRQRLAAVLGQASGSDRGQVVAEYQDVLAMKGSPARGAALAKEHCLACHTVVGIGTPIGPDLSGISRQPKDRVLADILDPSNRVSADFVAYSVITSHGTTLVGLILAETAEAITLRMADGEQRTLRKADIDEVRASGKSFMPDGIERKIERQGLADLLAFLWQPERELLEENGQRIDKKQRKVLRAEK
jgi:putative heme-binding domain-containing protein